MKTAVFHNAMDTIGGAEMVGLTLAKELKADFYSTNIDYEKIRKMGFKDIPMRSIGRVPQNAPWRQQIALQRFRNAQLKEKYDMYITDGDWAVSGVVNHKPNLWYVHSPIREIWDLYQYTRKHTVPWYARWVFDAWVFINRRLNEKYVSHVDKLVCNSRNTQQRIKKYLKRDAAVIHPPVDTYKFRYKKNGEYWLSVNRLITHKRVDMQINAFRKMPEEKLIIVGSYEMSRHFKKYARYIESTRPKNVEIISWVNFDYLVELYANCKAFITTAKDEDFGLTAVEAMASGKPVIAPNEGGYKETVINGVTGKLIDDINEEKLAEAVKQVGISPQHYKDACLKRARQFDTKVFIKRIKEVINERNA